MGILVTDFDGTLTKFDFFDLVRNRWPSTPGDDPWEDYVAGKISHFEALERIFRRIRATEEEISDLVEAMEFDPAASTALQSLQGQGWEVVVASAGCAWYIRRHLDRAGALIPVHANPGRFVSTEGLLMKLPEESPFFSRETGVNKLAIVRDAIARSPEVAFAGDGRPDLEPSLLVPPTHRFARGWLAETLTARSEAFIPFDRWSDIPKFLLPSPC